MLATIHLTTQRSIAHLALQFLGRAVNPLCLELQGKGVYVPPRVANDLPAYGKPILPSSTGYRTTFKLGVQTFYNGSCQEETTGIPIRDPPASPAVNSLKAASKVIVRGPQSPF